MRRRLLRLGPFILLGYLTLIFVAGVFVAEVTLHPGRRSLSAKDDVYAETIAANHESHLADVVIKTQDGVTLTAWSFQRETATRMP